MAKFCSSKMIRICANDGGPPNHPPGKNFVIDASTRAIPRRKWHARHRLARLPLGQC
ncbi:hypothetical protein BOS5A_200581 [Bosea sp. EC-HK365B]|nr:hypothetical protein BOSE7B_40686 [Bosea sp. 7B]VVT58429.1 hypothetical protein BOS5A_200581 [Bosea sp. EC-HK365B]VXC82848.1 hypothetical protein BOSE127_60084 [Bosea sp. 127]